MISRSVICVAAILRAFPCQQFAGPLETCPGAIYRAYDRRPAAQRARSLIQTDYWNHWSGLHL